MKTVRPSSNISTPPQLAHVPSSSTGTKSITPTPTASPKETTKRPDSFTRGVAEGVKEGKLLGTVGRLPQTEAGTAGRPGSGPIDPLIGGNGPVRGTQAEQRADITDTAWAAGSAIGGALKAGASAAKLVEVPVSVIAGAGTAAEIIIAGAAVGAAGTAGYAVGTLANETYTALNDGQTIADDLCELTNCDGSQTEDTAETSSTEQPEQAEQADGSSGVEGEQCPSDEETSSEESTSSSDDVCTEETSSEQTSEASSDASCGNPMRDGPPPVEGMPVSQPPSRSQVMGQTGLVTRNSLASNPNPNSDGDYEIIQNPSQSTSRLTLPTENQTDVQAAGAGRGLDGTRRPLDNVINPNPTAEGTEGTTPSAPLTPGSATPARRLLSGIGGPRRV